MHRLALVAAVVLAVAVGLDGPATSASPADRPRPVANGDQLATAMPVATVVPATAPPPPPAPARPVRASRSAARPRPAGAPVAVGGDVWGALARCESGGNPRAVGGGGRYFGAFQFSLGSWRSLGYAGNPVDHPYGTQLEAAQRLQARSGWGQWPHCARKLGLR
jgi:hypothetical protein